MTTGSFWNLDNPDKPWGPFDPDDIIHIPYDFSDFLTDQGVTYTSHVITCETGLSATNVGVTVGGIVTISVQRTNGLTLNAGQKYGVTVQITCSDGQKKSKTLYLKAKEQ